MATTRSGRRLSIALCVTVLAAFIVVLPAGALAQPPSEAWCRADADRGVVFHSVWPTSDGGCILGGSGAEGPLLEKTDARGGAVWTRALGNGVRGEMILFVQQMPDGGYIAFSSAQRLTRTDAEANPLWEYVLPAGKTARSLRGTADGGCVLAGEGGGAFLLRVAPGGSEAWNRTFGADALRSVQPLSRGGYVAAGASGGLPLLIEVGADGEVLRREVYEGPGNGTFTAVQPAGEGYILTFVPAAELAGLWSDGSLRPSLVRTDAEGEVLWQRPVAGDTDLLRYVMPDPSGGYVVLASGAGTMPGTGRSFLIGTDAEGREAWTQAFDDTVITSLHLTDDGGCIMTGIRQASDGAEAGVVIRLGAAPAAPASTPGFGAVVALAALPAALALVWRRR